jgi:adenylate cyclase
MGRRVGNVAAAGEPARPAARSSRRTVTVLFIDIVGFTALVDQLDPEDVWALQKDYFAVVARAVRAGGGVVEKYIGDAVVAAFGTRGDRPDRTGDDPTAVTGAATRAVRAGLRMQEALRDYPLAGRFRVQTRVGVATGVAIVDLDAAADGGQAMLSGSVVATASRLQMYAPHGTVVVCAATRAATHALVGYQELPSVVVAGKPYPLDLWRALSPAPPVRVPAAGVPASAAAPGLHAAGLPARFATGLVTARGGAVHARAGPA